MNEQIINQLINDFNFTLIFVINILTYIIIKCIEDINKTKPFTSWQKRFIFIIVSIIMGCVNYVCTDIPINVIINSCIIAPVSWSWLIKPIINKLGIDYKKI